ncbi:glycerol-3-phosphate transporter permease [Weissella viridescens]|uniref:Glycerol-3-phosphate transporter permease n=1 Tax=Weissella viridescens TaxID=1629 RepID=A0A380P3A4_WEIVI|nr:glycerol-3-phosphate transporter permease [Weissella viridescens]
MQKKQNLLALVLLLPSIVVLGMFVFYPMIKTFWLITQLTDLMGNPIKFVGFKNFINLFHSDSFMTSITVTMIFVIATSIFTVLCAYFLAILASKKCEVWGFSEQFFQQQWGFR